jgi:hypothetical protein
MARQIKKRQKFSLNQKHPAEGLAEDYWGRGPRMLIHDSSFAWEGWGGKLRLGSGKCRLRIFDTRKAGGAGLTYLRPLVVVVTDLPDSPLSVKSCTSHVATKVSQRFHLDPQRMLWVEYYPAETYGMQGARLMPERFEAVDFTWLEGKAIYPKWRPLVPPLLDLVRDLVQETP